MTTTGRRYIRRTHDKKASSVLDPTTKAVLNAVLAERRGEGVRAYLLSKGRALR